MYSFNLVDQKWIPCIMLDGTRDEKSIVQVILEANEIKEISDNSPLVTVALHRLLLAIIHRSFERGYGPANAEEWNAIWRSGHLSQETIITYLDNFHNRFDLFDDSYPFYQCASLSSINTTTQSEPISIGNLLHDSAIYLDKATLFDHGTESTLRSFTPSEASRFLVTFQSFTIGGFSSLSKPRIKGEESAKASPLIKGAVCLIQGNNLFETLMLNLVVYNIPDAEPFQSEKSDKPTWENNSETNPEECGLNGYFHLLTWQSRRIKYLPEQDAAGNTFIRNVLIRKGNQLPDNYTLHMKEPMLAFQKRLKSSEGLDPWPPVTFRENRSLWRDSLSLFRTVTENNARPRTFDWISDLVENGYLPASFTLNTAVFGLVSFQATISLWRHERLPLPLKYLQDETLVLSLKEALEIAEETGKLLTPGFITIKFLDKKGNQKSASVRSPLWNMVKLILFPETDIQKIGSNQKKEIEDMINSLSPSRSYWAALGIAFNQFLIDLAQDETEGRIKSLSEWAKEISKAVCDSFEETMRSLDQTGRILKAISKAENEFYIRLKNTLKQYLSEIKEGGEL
jgi:CRISPR system Cascade subunit CasA